MLKMDMIWIAAAKLIYPSTLPRTLATGADIEDEVGKLFKTRITSVMLAVHLVSWEDRQANRHNPVEGGNRCRYLFRTADGTAPAEGGRYRLYKRADGRFDGKDKTGRTCPEWTKIADDYHYLVDWYRTQYLEG